MMDHRFNGPYDIVVVGAGPAGSSATKAAAERGARVLLIDRKQRIGVPVQCAELVTRWIGRACQITSACIIQPIETMGIYLFDGVSFNKIDEAPNPGYMLDRSLFDKELAASASLKGAEIATHTRAVDFSPEGVWIENGSDKEFIRSKVIIGADGVHSRVARWAGAPRLRDIATLQYEIVIPRPQSEAEIFFHPKYEGGYAWFFPKGKTANVGMGIIPSKTSLLTDLLDRFVDWLAGQKGISTIAIVGKTGGSVPCEISPQTNIGNALFVGDAAGHAHPITGAGIFNAVMGGEIAGRIAAEAAIRGDLRLLNRYEAEWQEAFGKTLSYAAMKRRFLESNWNQHGSSFEGFIRKTWVNFKEYYEDRRRYETGS